MTARRFVREYLPPAAFLLALVALWEAWVAWRDIPGYILAPPSSIWPAFIDNLDVLPDHLRATTFEAVIGLLIGAAAGAVVAVAIQSVAFVRRVLYPVLVGSQTIPMIVLAPLLVVWFGFGYTPKVVVVVLIVFFPVAISTAAGLEAADRDLADLVRSMGGSRTDVLRHALLPAAIPSFFSGLRIAATYAVAGAVIGEWVGAQRGLGVFIDRSNNSFDIDQVFVAVVLIALLSIALFGMVHVAARLASPWMYVDVHQREGTLS